MHNENGRASADHGYTDMARDMQRSHNENCRESTERHSPYDAYDANSRASADHGYTDMAHDVQRSHNANGRASAGHDYADTHHTMHMLQMVVQTTNYEHEDVAVATDRARLNVMSCKTADRSGKPDSVLYNAKHHICNAHSQPHMCWLPHISTCRTLLGSSLQIHTEHRAWPGSSLHARCSAVVARLKQHLAGFTQHNTCCCSGPRVIVHHRRHC